jgi:hypothetical protein
MAAVALMWGSSFLLIDLGVDHLRPELVAFGRVAFGAAALGLLPRARRPVPAGDRGAIVLLGVTWMAAPFVLFAVAEQAIDSSLAGMINAGAPLFTALIAALWLGRRPAPVQAAGLAVGFGGVVAVCLPGAMDGAADAAGVGLVVAATALYGVAFNVGARPPAAPRRPAGHLAGPARGHGAPGRSGRAGAPGLRLRVGIARRGGGARDPRDGRRLRRVHRARRSRRRDARVRHHVPAPRRRHGARRTAARRGHRPAVRRRDAAGRRGAASVAAGGRPGPRATRSRRRPRRPRRPRRARRSRASA